MNQSESLSKAWKNIILQPILTTHQSLQRSTALKQAWQPEKHPGLTQIHNQAFWGNNHGFHGGPQHMNQSESLSNPLKNIILQPILTTHQLLQRSTALKQAWQPEKHPGLTQSHQKPF